MKIHPREKIVNAAEAAVRLAIASATRELTTAETLRVVCSILSSEIGGIAKYSIREERHGDVDKPGGRA